MDRHQAAKTLTTFLFAGSVFLTCCYQTNAQQNPPQINPQTTNKSADEIKDADVSITANVTAKELKFEAVPNPTVEFPGRPERKTLWETDRQNLPQSVEPGVTYRNIGIQLRIASRFADIERIVAEALGEVPVTDAPSAQPQNQNPPVSSNQKEKPEKTKTQYLSTQRKTP